MRNSRKKGVNCIDDGFCAKLVDDEDRGGRDAIRDAATLCDIQLTVLYSS